jgi:hypothetical protein
MLSTEHGVRVPREGVEIFDCLAKLAVGSQSILKYGFQNMGSHKTWGQVLHCAYPSFALNKCTMQDLTRVSACRIGQIEAALTEDITQFS